MNVLVTGGSGKIGGYVLRELLAAGHTVSNYSQTAPFVEPVRHIDGDITDLERMRETSGDHEAIVHLAAVPGPGITTPERLMYVNDRGTYTVLEAAVGAGRKEGRFWLLQGGDEHGLQTERHAAALLSDRRGAPGRPA